MEVKKTMSQVQQNRFIYVKELKLYYFSGRLLTMKNIEIKAMKMQVQPRDAETQLSKQMSMKTLKAVQSQNGLSELSDPY